MAEPKTNFVNEGDLKSVTTTIGNGNELLTTDLEQNVEVNYISDSCSDDVRKHIVKAPRPDSKLILQNMEEVLNSVKKKHRQKHKRKREQKKLALMEAAASAIATATTELESEIDEDGKVEDEKSNDQATCLLRKTKNDVKPHGKRSKTQPLQENGHGGDVSRSGRKSKLLENKSPLKNATANGDILRHFQRTPKKNEVNIDSGNAEHEEGEDHRNPKSINKNGTMEKTSTTTKQATKPMNAFEVMMNARNKTIGSNTPGKETSPTGSQESTTISTKRKLLLQEWADKKGASKRKLEEETRAAYVEQQLEHRAKRLKQMLTNGVTSKQDSTATQRTPSERSGAKKAVSDSKAAKENLDNPKRRKRTAMRLESTDSDDNAGKVAVNIDSETEEFLAKLNSPTKKRDSLLGYFPRKESPTEKSIMKKDIRVKGSTPKNDKALETKRKTQTKCEADEPSKNAVKNFKTKPPKREEINKSETPKSRIRRRSTKSGGVTIDTPTALGNGDTEATEVISQEEEVELIQTPSGRPKRSCAGKARYDYDLEVSPTKAEATKRVVNKTTTKKCESPAEYVDEIIQLDDSNMSLSPEKVPKKLAPVFVRAMPKPSPDPAALKARQDFLMSGVPEKMRLEMEKQKQFEQTYDEELDYFPHVCHIQQLDAEEDSFLQSKRDSILKLKLKPCEFINHALDIKANATFVKENRRRSCSSNFATRGNAPKMKGNAELSSKKHKAQQTSSAHILPLPTIENKRTVIKSWKTEFERFPTYKCYNQMREKYRFFSALDSSQNMEQVSESFVVTRQTERRERSTEAAAAAAAADQEDVKPPPTAPNGELLFTEKYKPMLVEQVLVNLVPVTQLRDFLAAWANGSGRNSQTIDDSFDASNDSNSSMCNASGNAVVLLGPVSSGKTNAVYALANDMNFNVLEINAGMKRTGKRLIQELQEATQSHQIRKDSTPTQSTSKAQKNLLRMSLNGKKLKKYNSQSHLDADNSNGSSSPAQMDISQNTRKCLILIEDADVVFDQLDCGFTDAIYTLAASSKRPVIVMATNPNCAHLQRLMNQNTIYFTPPNSLNISRFMAVLSLIENCPINLDDLVSLYLFNGRDLRRTLLELQFFIQSGGDRCKLLKSEIQQEQHQQQHTPQKGEGAKRELGFYASPAKCSSLTDDEQSATQQAASQEPDEQLGRDRANGVGDSSKITSSSTVYIHRSLFNFFTGNQNEKWRIPFPVDFGLLRVNLTDVFQCSQRLYTHAVVGASEKIAKHTDTDSPKQFVSKRRTRTPKASDVGEVNCQKQPAAKPPLDVLCDFYDNISIAALLGTHNADMSEGNRNAVCGSGILGGGADMGIDRLLPNYSEHIAHEIVEQAISVNLAAQACPYNLFNTPEERLSLCDYMNTNNSISSRSLRTRALDVEPALRAICRSEKQRAMQERRSTRFYHYLRHSSANHSSFSTEPFDKACAILHDEMI